MPLPSETSEPLPCSVLFVDDDQLLLKAFKLHLQSLMPVFLATSGEEGLEVVEREQCPIVVTDMYMHTMNGIDFIVHARKQAPKSVYMLLTSSRESQTAVSAINDADVFCIINKPCSMADLVDFVQAAYEQYKRTFKAGED